MRCTHGFSYGNVGQRVLNICLDAGSLGLNLVSHMVRQHGQGVPKLSEDVGSPGWWLEAKCTHG